MHDKIADSRLVIFPKSGHMTFVDQPNQFIEAVNGFLHPAMSDIPEKPAQ
jgi:pimeloyl-ACP methyl ester carboxylesterase